MDAKGLLKELHTLGIQVSLRGDKVRLEPGSRVPIELVAQARALKPALVSLLSDPQGGRELQLPEGWQEAVDAWVRAGCPKGDPIMIGLNLLALQQLSLLPREDRHEALGRWRAQFQARRRERQRAH